MDTIDRSDSNLPAPFPTASSSLQALGPVFNGDLATTQSSQVNSRTILRGLTRHWWQILVLWLIVSAPIVYAIKLLVKPTYEASSTLRIQPTKPSMYEMPHENSEMRSVLPYLQTQANLFTTDKVLDIALNDPSVKPLPFIRESDDPKAALREDLAVEIVEGAYLIRVGLELADGDQAAKIVNAIVAAYLNYNVEFNRSTNSKTTQNLNTQLTTLQKVIDQKKVLLQGLYATTAAQPQMSLLNEKKSDGDAAQPTFSKLTENHVQGWVDTMVKTDFELIEAKAALEIFESQAAKQANEQENAQALNQIDEDLEPLIVEEFRKDPEVIALKDAIIEMRNELDHNKAAARLGNDPSRRVIQKELDKLTAQYNEVWKQKHGEIRKRLSIATSSPQSLSTTIADLRIKVETLQKKQRDQAELYRKLDQDHKTAKHDTFEAVFLDAEVKGLMTRVDKIKANLDQLAFDASQDVFRVEEVDPATAPKTPTNNKHIKYMLAAPVGVLFMILGLFMLLEIKAERIGDPDILSNRVRSEVYALPPLPTTRAQVERSASRRPD